MSAPYISRPSAEEFTAAFVAALSQPQAEQRLFYVYGMGGVGKSTLLQRLQADQEPNARFAKVSFGETEAIATPIKLMLALHRQLPQPNPLYERPVQDLLKADPFLQLYEKYDQTLHKLNSEPLPGKTAVDVEQKKAVDQLVNQATTFALPLMTQGAVNPATAAAVSEGIKATATTLLSVKDLLVQHRATKKDAALRELMEYPLLKLTQAFVQSLSERAQVFKQPVVLVLDTYEKAGAFCPGADTWLWRTLLTNCDVAKHPIRILLAGRYPLAHEGWNKLSEQVYECELRRFNEAETASYVQQADVAGETAEIYRITKGLPYYLNWIREEQAKGRTVNLAAGRQKIEDLLLQNLTSIQKTVVQLAALCHWFDRPLIQNLVELKGINFQTGVDPERHCFDWLQQLDFVVRDQRLRLDDVVRDVLSQALYRNDSLQFEQLHQLLADYFEERADQLVPADRPPAEKYNDPQWRQCQTESLYHTLFTRQGNSQLKFLSCLFESVYFNQADIVETVLGAIEAELNLQPNQDSPLPEGTRKFLRQVKPAVLHSWAVLTEEPIDYDFNEQVLDLSRAETDQALQVCFSQIDQLQDLAKYVALLYKARRCSEAEKVSWLLKASEQAQTIVTEADPEFSSGLFLWDIGNALVNLGRHEEAIASYDQALHFQPDLHEAWYNRGTALDNLGRPEEAIASYDQALHHKPDLHEAWNNRGTALDNLGRHEEAIASFDQALHLKPDDHEAWNNRGTALDNLGRHEEAIASFDQALHLKPDDHEAWYNRGVALVNLGRYEEAIASFDQALHLKPDDHEAWNNRGVALVNLGRYEEAIASYDQALHFQPDDPDVWYGKACSYALQGNVELALENLQRAIDLNPNKYREMAKTDSDFASLRDDERFQALLG